MIKIADNEVTNVPSIGYQLTLCGILLTIALIIVDGFLFWMLGTAFSSVPAAFWIVMLAMAGSIAAGVAVWQAWSFFPRNFWAIPSTIFSFSTSASVLALIPFVLLAALAVLMAGAGGFSEATKGEYGPGLSRGGPVIIAILCIAVPIVFGSGFLVISLPTLVPTIAIWMSTPSMLTAWSDARLWQLLHVEASDSADRQRLAEISKVLVYCGGPAERHHARHFLKGEEPKEFSTGNGEPQADPDDFSGFKLAQALYLPVFLTFACIGGQNVFLYLGGNAAIADVTETKRDGVRYRFEVNGNSYSHSDITGRRNLFAGMYPSDANAAKENGVVIVRYMPANPWVNAPVGEDWRVTSNPWLAVLFFGGLELFIVVGLVFSYIAFSKRHLSD